MKHKAYLEAIFKDIQDKKITFEQFATAITNWVAENKEFNDKDFEEKKPLPGQEELF